MRPPFAYYGGKSLLAPRIVALLPEHRVYTEPFAGSLSVLLAKAPTPHEVVNDLDGDLVNFWRQLRERPEELAQACRLTPYAREEFALSRDLEGIDDLERMHAVAERLRTVVVENRDAVEVISAYDAPDAVHYVDPPYLGSSRSDAGGGGYAVEMRDEGAHQDLAAALHAAEGTVVLSGYASPLYETLYADWERHETDVHRASAARSGHRSRATEVLWSNRPLGAQLTLATTGANDA